MKKLLFIALLLFLNFCMVSCIVVHSYTGAAFAGFGSSGIHGDGTSWGDPPAGHAGVHFNIVKINDKFSLGTEVMGTIQGSKYEETNLSGRVQFIYLHVPLLLRYQSPKGFFGEAGLQPGILLSAKDKYNDIMHDYKDYTNTFEFGIPAGFGYEFKNHIGIGVRVIQGISNINKNDPEKDHNILGVFRVTYGFSKKEKK